jgi:superfamily II DNA or RNA helicase
MHQASCDAIIRRVCAGDPCREILPHVTPGGGKSLLPIIAGRLITEGLADKIAWIVPRLTLQYQAEGSFIDPYFCKMLRHNLTIRSSTNDFDPSRGLSGFATTYQALGMSNAHAIHDFKRYRYILVADEFHHMDKDGVWYKAVEPLYELASFRVFMTGTLARGDKKEIGFMRYRTVAEELKAEIRQPDVRDDETRRYIPYTRTDALAERAIIPLKFFLHDGATRWRTKDGQEHEYGSFSLADGNISAAIYTAINTEFAEELLDQGVVHWNEYRRRNRSSQMLVVAANIELARRAMDYLRRCNVRCELATSADTDEARESIRRLKNGTVQCLVGVAMFYEGFDHKPISHIISLTHIRSTPWIEQMVARAVRVDPAIPYDEQYAHIFAPADPHFRAIVASIEAEQLEFIRKRKKSCAGDQLSLFGDSSSGEKDDPIIPLGSSLAGQREMTVGYHHPEAPPIRDRLTPSEREHRLRTEIEEHVRRYALNAGHKPLKINRDLKRTFGKARDVMRLDELEKVREHLLIQYPLDYRRRPAVRRSATQL